MVKPDVDPEKMIEHVRNRCLGSSGTGLLSSAGSGGCCELERLQRPGPPSL